MQEDSSQKPHFGFSAGRSHHMVQELKSMVGNDETVLYEGKPDKRGKILELFTKRCYDKNAEKKLIPRHIFYH